MAHRRQVNPYAMQYMSYGMPTHHYAHPAPPVQRRRAPHSSQGHHVAPPRSSQGHHPQQHGHSSRQVGNHGHSGPRQGYSHSSHGHSSHGHSGYGHSGHGHVVHQGGYPSSTVNDFDNHQVRHFESSSPQYQNYSSSGPRYNQVNQGYNGSNQGFSGGYDSEEEDEGNNQGFSGGSDNEEEDEGNNEEDNYNEYE